MTALNFKIMVIGLASLLVASVAHGKCYPGLDCPEDLPGANKTPVQPAPSPSTSQPVPETMPEPTPASEPTAESQALPEEQTTVETGNIVGRKATQEPDSVPDDSDAPSKYKYQKRSKYPK